MTTTWAAPTGAWEQRYSPSPPVVAKKFTGPLKICLISETLHAGVGRHIVDVASALSERGHEIHLLYSPRRLEPHMLAAVQQQRNVRCHSVDMPHGICTGDLTAFLKIKEYIRANGPFDIIHGESSKGGGYARLLKLFGAGAAIYSPHAFITLSPVVPLLKRALYHILEVALAELTDTIVCSSRSEQEHGQSLGIRKHKLKVIVNGGAATSAPHRDTARAALGITGDQVVIGFVGRMEDQKAPQRLIEAAIQILPSLPHIHLLMIGDGAKRPFLQTRLEQAGLADRASWLGAVDAQQYMPAMDIFALPSLYEGFAYVLIEALYAGLPIVSTPVGGTHEAIIPELNGIVVPHGSTDHMAAALRRLATDNALRLSMARASSARANEFSIPRMIDDIENLYLKVAANRLASRKLRRNSQNPLKEAVHHR